MSGVEIIGKTDPSGKAMTFVFTEDRIGHHPESKPTARV
jgi:hypothetical protein